PPLPSTTPATPALYPLSLHDALPICLAPWHRSALTKTVEPGPFTLLSLRGRGAGRDRRGCRTNSVRASFRVRLFQSGFKLRPKQDRKSTRLNSSHVKISYAVFCLKKK